MFEVSNPESFYPAIRLLKFLYSEQADPVYQDVKTGDEVFLKFNNLDLLEIIVDFKLNNIHIYTTPNPAMPGTENHPPSIKLTMYVREALYDSLFNVLSRRECINSILQWNAPHRKYEKGSEKQNDSLPKPDDNTPPFKPKSNE